MNTLNNNCFKTTFWKILLFAAVCAWPALESKASIELLADQNSVAKVDTGSSAGMFNWSVNGQNQLKQQWFWFRVGNTPEAPINTISAPSITRPDARTLYTTYDNGLYSVSVDYLLTGGSTGPGVVFSDVSEMISIHNHGASQLDFHFFQYSDFNLNGLQGGQTAQIGKNIRGRFNEAVLQSTSGAALTETVVTPGANHGEAGIYPQTFASLNDGVASTLGDNLNPVGPGDATWALEWDFTIAPGGSVGISKDKLLEISAIPEASAWIAGLFCLVVGIFRCGKSPKLVR